jgi:hypothetical protein
MRRTSDDKDWRLRIDPQQTVDLDGLISRARDDAGESTRPSALSDEIVLSHDGSTVFAYAPSESAIRDARDAIQSAIDGERHATVRISHWEPSRRQWHQIDPPLTYEQEDEMAAAASASNDKDQPPDQAAETRPVVCVIGKLIRKSFEAQMVAFAQDLHLKCDIVEHPHLLSTQVVFEVTGPTNAVDEFATHLKSEARFSSRLDPGLVPFGLP